MNQWDSRKLFKPILTSLAMSSSIPTPPKKDLNDFLSKQDETQLHLLNETCILVNEADQVVGNESKINCHLLSNITNGMLHRAFSIFLFDEKNRLLIQQRSKFKITFPSHWTNTCCSHPIYIDEELDAKDGIKRAAQRRLLYEFGINVENFNLFHYITRIHYKAPNVPFDGIFGEHEIDYILFLKGDFEINSNENEIETYKYVDSNELKQILINFKRNNKDFKLTPWFELICDKYLFDWWSKLDNLESITDRKKISKFV